MIKKYSRDEDEVKESLYKDYLSCKKSNANNAAIQGFCSHYMLTISYKRFKKKISYGKHAVFLSIIYRESIYDVKAALINEFPDICKK